MLNAAGHWIWNWVFGWGGLGGVVSIGAWLLWYFTPTFLANSKTVILHIAVTATAITFASTYLSAHYFNYGYQVAINQIAAKNKGATDAVNKVESTVDECFASGGTFDDVDGVCRKE